MPTQTSPFQGIWIPLVTPFSGGAVDGGALRRLVRHYAAAGVDGLVVCGSTGEAAALDDAEQLAVLDAVLSVADGLPVMMGLAGNHQGHVLRRLSAFGTRPLAGILAPAPYYVRPGQAGASAYFRCLADASRFRWRCTTFPTAPARRWTRPRCWSWRRTRTSPPSRTAAARWKRPWR